MKPMLAIKNQKVRYLDTKTSIIIDQNRLIFDGGIEPCLTL